MSIIDQFKSDGSDKRYFRRFGVELPAIVSEVRIGNNESSIIDDTKYGSVIKDLSLSGLNFISKQRFDIGKTVKISAFIVDSSITLVGTIQRCKRDRIAADYYEMGIQFIKTEHNTIAIPIIGKYIQQHSINVKIK